MTEKHSRKPMTYKDSGVDIEAGESMVQRIKPLVERTRGPRVMGGIGGFAGLFRLDYDEELFQRNYDKPVLVSCTDGVGTKLKVAFALGKVDTVGIDLVAMNVNDLVCVGAEPLFFLDYLAVGRLEPGRMAEIVKGISDGCCEAGCALLGGETAEMPDFYESEEFDMAGFSVGVVERDRIIDGRGVETGDVVIGMASNGLHSNGFGLARRVLMDQGDVQQRPPELEGRSIGEELLRPTRIYVKPVLDVVEHYRQKRVVKAMAHVTGGGLPGNLPRVVPEGLTVRVKRDSWPVPPVFQLIASRGPVDPIEMMRVFNMGVGFCLVVSQGVAQAVMNRLRRAGELCWQIGKVVEGGPELEWA